MEFPSKLIEQAVQAFTRLPGIGRKSATRLVLYLLQQEKEESEQLAGSISKMRTDIQFCSICHNVSDEKTCSICTNSMRRNQVICVVENIRDLLAVENTQQFNGVYHVLGGKISPIDGIGPDQLNIASLVNRVKEQDVGELIMALSPTIEGDTTVFYLSKIMKDLSVKITTIARGVGFGGELEYVDEITLGRSIMTRQPFDHLLQE